MSQSLSSMVKDSVRSLIPYGFIERHRRQFRLTRLGLPPTPRHLEAIEACRYELWPKFLRDKSRPWSLVDVGANEGDFVEAVTTLANVPVAYAIEPQPACHERLRSRLDNVAQGTLVPKAVGDHNGVIPFNITRHSKMASVLRPAPEVRTDYQEGAFDITEQVDVPIVTLDHELNELRDVGLLKLDVQGFEREVLAGATSLLQRTKAVLMEVNYVPHYEAGATFDEVYMMLRDSGFVLSGVSAPYGSCQDGPLWADAMFVQTSCASRQSVSKS
tara:strand:- start:84180 stop:84998 length:819 start_codon:yes stop_codon:yes gene_type:complete